jgi:exopolysaccharide biosynthesis polyprenyl glycosylphosphotransferase
MHEVCESLMATSEFWQRVSASVSASSEWEGGKNTAVRRKYSEDFRIWMALDGITILAAAILATLYELRTGPVAGARGFVHGTLFHGRPVGILLALLCGFTIALLITSRRLHLYAPLQLNNILHEQRLSLQACLTSGLLLTGTLYLVKAEYIPRGIVLLTIGLVTLLLSLRRLIYRLILYGRFERGMGTRNVLIVGTGPEAVALRNHLERIRHLGYTFKGFIGFPGSSLPAFPGEVLGPFDTLFLHARKQFVDEIFFTTPCERSVVQHVLEQARNYGIDLRVVPEMYNGLPWNNPIEYIGQFPTIPLHRGQVPAIGLLLKRAVDIFFASLVLLIVSPLLLLIAVAIRLDSRGPVFYSSERLGKKGRVFRCIKFRTMVRDAEKRKAELLHLNERDGVLFKIENDPRITRLGRFLRKYSLDELPQFFNVLRGDMSVVGPRPPLASEVHKYELSHLRRLDVTPGITGLWQVQGRQDPSFDSYVSLDMTYIENWSIWLDIRIMLRTVGVVLAGTGS